LMRAVPTIAAASPVSTGRSLEAILTLGRAVYCRVVRTAER
jgi:hypothetical protein